MNCLVFNATPLVHFARAGALEVLPRLTEGWRRVTTQAVVEEVLGTAEYKPHQNDVRDAQWLEIVRVDSLADLRAFASYANVFGSGVRNLGEASVLAWAEVHGAIAVVDDKVAKEAGRRRGVEVHGTLWLIFEGFKRGWLDQATVVDLIRRLEDTQQWFPCTADEAFDWAKGKGLLG